MRTISVEYICPHCAASHTIQVRPAVPAQVYGPPEDCYPGEPVEIDPGACEYCCKEFDEEAVFEIAAEERDNQRQERSDAMLAAREKGPQ